MIDWKKVQARLGVPADGVAGPRTYAALLKFASHGRADPALADKMAAIFAVSIPRHEIDRSANRLVQFMATTSHETGDFTVFSENLNYSVQNILGAWPSRFKTAADAAPYAHNPAKLAEKVYGGRFGNPPGRAFDFRGGGLIQTTFYANYLAAEKATGLPLTAHPELLHDPLTSIEPACAYWQAQGCNELADADPTGRRARVKVNGGTLGMPDVLARVPRLLGVLT
jgi:putative chitinase